MPLSWVHAHSMKLQIVRHARLPPLAAILRSFAHDSYHARGVLFCVVSLVHLYADIDTSFAFTYIHIYIDNSLAYICMLLIDYLNFSVRLDSFFVFALF